MLDRLGRGMFLALRSGAAPLWLGARLVGRLGAAAPAADLPAVRNGLGVSTKSVLDEIFFATEVALAPLVSHRDRQRMRREIGRALRLAQDRGWIDDPASYHRAPDAPDAVCIERSGFRGFAYETLTFESGYAPHPGEPGLRRWRAYRSNRLAWTWVLRHDGPPRPWVVCVPGYRMGSPLVDFTGFKARWLHAELGLNVAIPVLPFHGPRRHGSRGGDGYLRGDFIDTLHAQAQAVWDTRRLLAWLRSEGAPAVGLHGISLGGYTAALVAALEPTLNCVIAGVPAADFPRLVRSHVPSAVVRLAERAGYPFAEIERLLRLVSPLALPPGVPRDRCFLYAGLVDRLTSPEHARVLWEHWGHPRVSWYQGGHVSFLWEREVKALLLEALVARGFVERAA